jgi:hypothetical protein
MYTPPEKAAEGSIFVYYYYLFAALYKGDIIGTITTQTIPNQYADQDPDN